MAYDDVSWYPEDDGLNGDIDAIAKNLRDAGEMERLEEFLMEIDFL